MTTNEVIVWGVPLSLQAKNAKHLAAWKKKVNDAGCEAVPEDSRHEFARMTVAIVHFAFDWEQGDLDNIAKPILDGLCGPAYFDDKGITQLTLRRTELGKTQVEILDPPPILAGALARAREERADFIYIRIADEVDHRRLPWTP